MPGRLPLFVLLAAAIGAAHAERSAEINYKLQCMGCHLPDGTGHPPAVPDLTRELGEMLSVPGGRDYLVQVPGASQAPISDAELAAVVNFLVTQFVSAQAREDYEPFTAQQVARLRGAPLRNVHEVREELLAAIAARGGGDRAHDEDDSGLE